jgi:hypothetical protein
MQLGDEVAVTEIEDFITEMKQHLKESHIRVWRRKSHETVDREKQLAAQRNQEGERREIHQMKRQL